MDIFCAYWVCFLIYLPQQGGNSSSFSCTKNSLHRPGNNFLNPLINNKTIRVATDAIMQNATNNEMVAPNIHVNSSKISKYT